MFCFVNCFLRDVHPFLFLPPCIRQGMAPVLEMAMVAKLLMILIDTTMMWDVPKKSPDKLHHGKVAVYSA